ncbi:MAG: AMP-dependent synthetase/ligase [Bacteroidota bacterium]
MFVRGESNRRRVPTTLCELPDYHTTHYTHPNALNAKHEGTWKGISSRDVRLLVRRTALGLYSVGVRPGDRVALLSENSPQWVISAFAISSIGAATVPIYTTQAPSQVEYILTNAGVKILLVSSEVLFVRVQSIFSHLHLSCVVVFGPFASGDGIITLEEVRSRGKALEEEQPGLLDCLRRDVKPESVASVIYTSGTTALPKGVALTHRNLTSNAVDASSVIGWHTGSDRALSFLPLSHIFELTLINIYLYRGIRVYFAESVETLAQSLQEVCPTVMTTVPRMLEKVYDKIRLKGKELTGLRRILFDWSIRLAARYNCDGGNSWWYGIQRSIASALVFSKWRSALGGKIRFIISGGAPLPAWLARVYFAAGIPILQGYGLTETSPVISVNTLKRNRIGSVGQLIPNAEVRIAEDGEILTRGPNVMKEFYNAPEATNAVFDGDWFRTGDIGYLDSDGFLFITDRKKDLIKKSSGKFIAPGPIETKLIASCYIDHAVVVGEGRKFAIALIFPNLANLKDWAMKRGMAVTMDAELLQLPEVQLLYQQEVNVVNAEVNPWERIIKFLLIESELTTATGDLTPTLKVRRHIVEQKYTDRINDLYEEFEHLHDVH